MASISEPTALPAPAPVLVNAKPKPVNRESESAIVTQPASPRAATKRIFSRRPTASAIGKL